jgi:hypothetical protein
LPAYLKKRQPTLGDLSNDVLEAYVYLESTSDVMAQIYVLDSDWHWADGGFVRLVPRTWTCLSFDADAPVYTVAGYAPTNVVEVGVQFLGMGDSTLLLDDFGI